MNKKLAACIISALAAFLLWMLFPAFGEDIDAAMFTLIGAVGLTVLSLVLLILAVADPDPGQQEQNTEPGADAGKAKRRAQKCRKFAIAQSVGIAVCTGVALLNHATDTGFMAGLLGDIILMIVLWVMLPVLLLVLIVWAVTAYRIKKQNKA